MELLESYLTLDTWKKDWNQTREDFKEFFEENRRPTVGGVEDPSKEEVEQYQAREENKGLIGKVSDAYFNPKSFEKSGRLYELLGVRVFQKVFMGTLGGLLRKTPISKLPSNYFIGEKRTIQTVKNFTGQIKYNEMIHTAGTLLACKDIHSGITNGGEGLEYHTIFFGLNLYLTLLQRYNRARAYNTIEQKIEQSTDSNTDFKKSL